MKGKKLSLVLSLVLSLALLAAGCEYDPSMYESRRVTIDDESDVVTAFVIESTEIRREPNEESEVVGVIVSGDAVIILGEPENGYYPVYSDDYTTGYVLESCLEINGSAAGSAAGSSGESRITATVIDNINIRRGPGQEYELIERIGPGPELVVVGEMENGYYPVEYNGEIGYAHHNFVVINEQIIEETGASEEAEPADGVITVENSEEFAGIMAIPDPYDSRIGDYISRHIGDEIQFDGYIAIRELRVGSTTRFDILVQGGDDDDSAAGPLFHYTDVNLTSDMRFDDNTPDNLNNGDRFTFTAEVLSYNEMTGLVELDPVSTVYRGD